MVKSDKRLGVAFAPYCHEPGISRTALRRRRFSCGNIPGTDAGNVATRPRPCQRPGIRRLTHPGGEPVPAVSLCPNHEDKGMQIADALDSVDADAPLIHMPNFPRSAALHVESLIWDEFVGNDGSVRSRHTGQSDIGTDSLEKLGFKSPLEARQKRLMKLAA